MKKLQTALLTAVATVVSTAAVAATCHVHLIDGQGGRLTSMPFEAFGDELEKEGYTVSRWRQANDPATIVASIARGVATSQKTCLIGFSLGANSTTWVASGWQGGKGLNGFGLNVDLLVAYDPTWLSTPTPLTSNVKRAILYQQTAWWYPTSWLFGRGSISAAEDGPKIETYTISTDHLLVQGDTYLHDITRKALSEVQ